MNPLLHHGFHLHLDLDKPAPEDVLAARQEAKLTQAQAALLLDVTERTWRNWEKGHSQMTYGEWMWFNYSTNLI